MKQTGQRAQETTQATRRGRLRGGKTVYRLSTKGKGSERMEKAETIRANGPCAANRKQLRRTSNNQQDKVFGYRTEHSCLPEFGRWTRRREAAHRGKCGFVNLHLVPALEAGSMGCAHAPFCAGGRRLRAHEDCAIRLEHHKIVFADNAQDVA